MTSIEVKQRRRDVDSYLKEHPTIGISNVKQISEGTGIKYKDVVNVTDYLKKQEKEKFSAFQVYGLRNMAYTHLIELKKYLVLVDKTINNTEDIEERTRSIDQAIRLRQNIHEIEQNSIGALTEEIDGDGLGK